MDKNFAAEMMILVNDCGTFFCLRNGMAKETLIRD